MTSGAKSATRADLHEAWVAAFAALGDAGIDQITPANLLLFAMRAAAKSGFPSAAIAIAKDAAPYFDGKLANRNDGNAADEQVIRIEGGLPRRSSS